ncbi:hypothetical protein [Polyangium fumosum]|uniref:Uncharacterized protein n=1 Tax=Polyangium fumosum TaxID=889272 RepID=A0A4V5PK10_9BACT|nr:hypothetical protein [Polyangium fumosum]TKC93620.1 hypothetical protein E8A74_49455 [Polyangium fumosum]
MMTRRAAHAWALGLFLSMVTVTGGCYIEHGNGPWDDEWSEGTGGYGPAGICNDMCDHLAGCGAIDADAFAACIDGCNAQHASTPYLVETGCICVIEAGCVDLDAYACPGAPLPPPPGNGGEGGYGTGGGSSDTGGYGGGGVGGSGEGGWSSVECEADCDCPGGASCIDNTCKVACVASCECPTGQSCVGGYCEAPPAPQLPCQVDCDCPSGQVCSAGVCAGD